MIDWEIRQLETPESLAEVETLQDVIWPGSLRDIVPVHVFLAAIHNGGLVLGAYANNRLVGMLFGFPGMLAHRDGMRLKHCSHMLGVHPEWRNSGLGFALKCTQRQFVLAQGINLITWTYDPLLSRNAYLNITRLGVVCNTYRRSEYGKMRDGINSGLDSDRFLVDWHLDSCRVEKSLNSRLRHGLKLDDLKDLEVEIIYATGKLQPPSGLPKLDQLLLSIEIPGDFSGLKVANFPLAKAWRQTSREIFEYAFANKYIVIDFLFDQGRSFYILEYQDNQ
jgi:predicted GNAT superfamily acetyltransferase